MNVLLISANQETINWLALAVAIRGHTSIRVADGITAIAHLVEHPCCVVIIDDVAGGDDERLRLCHQIRSLPQALNIAIWVITDPGNPARVVAAIDAGATSFLVHPLDANQLRTRFETLERGVGQCSSSRHPDIDIEHLLEVLPDVALVVDPAGQIRLASAGVESLLGFRSCELVGVNVESLSHPDDIRTLLQRIRSTSVHPEMTSGVDIRFQRSDREWQAVEVRCRDMRHLPSVAGILVVIRDAAERTCREQQLAQRIFFDPLTGLANLELFKEHVSRSLARSERVNRAIAVLYLDLNNIKRINDSDDPLTGDTVLTHVACQILGAIRSIDIAARLSDSEFAVLIEDFSEVDDLQAIADRIQAAIEMPVRVDRDTIVVTTAIAITLSEPGITSIVDLLRVAERARYRTKAQAQHHQYAIQDETSLAVIPLVLARPVSVQDPSASKAVAPSDTIVHDRETRPNQTVSPPTTGSPSLSGLNDGIASIETQAGETDAARSPLFGFSTRPADKPDLINRILALEAHIKTLIDDEVQ